MFDEPEILEQMRQYLKIKQEQENQLSGGGPQP